MLWKASLEGTALIMSPVERSARLMPTPPFFLSSHEKKSTPRGCFMDPHANTSWVGCQMAWKVVSHLPVWLSWLMEAPSASCGVEGCAGLVTMLETLDHQPSLTLPALTGSTLMVSSMLVVRILSPAGLKNALVTLLP